MRRRVDSGRHVTWDGGTVGRRAVVMRIAFAALAVAQSACETASPNPAVARMPDASAPDPRSNAAGAGREGTATGGAVGGQALLSELDFLSMRVGGGLCSSHMDCWESLTVRRPETLVLEDSHGELAFQISTADFARIEDLARTAEFGQQVDEALTGRGCVGFDVGISMQFAWRDGSVQNVPRVDACALAPGPGDAPRKILYEIMMGLRELKQRYLACPPWIEPEGYQSGVDPLPQRAICWNCFGKCNGGEMGGQASAP